MDFINQDLEGSKNIVYENVRKYNIVRYVYVL